MCLLTFLYGARHWVLILAYIFWIYPKNKFRFKPLGSYGAIARSKIPCHTLKMLRFKSLILMGSIISMSLFSNSKNNESKILRLEYNDLSAFHLDGEYLRFKNDGHYIYQSVVSGDRGRDELVFKGVLSSKKLMDLKSELSLIKISNLKPPPARTALPDQTSIEITLQLEDLSKVNLQFLGDDRHKLNSDGLKLLSVVRDLTSEVKKSKPVTINKNVLTLSPSSEDL